MIEKDEFDAWRDLPMTKEVFAALGALAEVCKDKWIKASWDNGNVDPVLLADLRARHEVVTDLVDMTFDDLERALEQSERD